MCWVRSVHRIGENSCYRSRFQRLNLVLDEPQTVWTKPHYSNRYMRIYLQESSSFGDQIVHPPLSGNDPYRDLPAFGGHLASKATLIKPETVVQWLSMYKDETTQFDAIFRTNIARRITVLWRTCWASSFFRPFHVYTLAWSSKIVVELLEVHHVRDWPHDSFSRDGRD